MKNLKLEIKAVSKKEYDQSFNRLHKRFSNSDIPPDNYNFIKDPKQIKTLLQEMKIKDITRRNYINSIIVFLKKNQNDNERKLIKEYTQLRNDYMSDHKEKKGGSDEVKEEAIQDDNKEVTKEDIEVLLQRLRERFLKLIKSIFLNDKNKMEMQNYILLKMFWIYRKKNELAKLKIYEDADPHELNNYIVSYPKKMYFHTDGFEKDRIPLDLRRDITKFLKVSPREYLFTNRKGLPYDQGDIGHVLRKILKSNLNKSASLNKIRKLK